MSSILLVDDNNSFVWAMRRVLEKSGHQVLGASDGAAALRCMEGVPVDLVITDLNLPGIDGIAIISELRRRGSKVPIIAVSGEIPLEPNFCLQRARRFGADRVIAKPFGPGTLLDTVAELLGGAPHRECMAAAWI